MKNSNKGAMHIVYAICRASLVNNPTPAVRHQIARWRNFLSDCDEIEAACKIDELLYAERNTNQPEIKQS